MVQQQKKDLCSGRVPKMQTPYYVLKVNTLSRSRPVIRRSYEDVDPLLCSKSQKVVTNVLNEMLRQAPSSQQSTELWSQKNVGFFNSQLHSRTRSMVQQQKKDLCSGRVPKMQTPYYVLKVNTLSRSRPVIRRSYEDVDPLLCSKSQKVVTNVLNEMLRQGPSSQQQTGLWSQQIFGFSNSQLHSRTRTMVQQQ